MLSASETRQQLREACSDANVALVSHLFESQPLTAEDASNALKNLMKRDPALVRVLLENGADTSVVDIRKIARSRDASNLLKLLAEYNYDFRSNGHRILQDFPHDRELLDWLLDQGVDINRTDSQRVDEGCMLPLGDTDDSLHLLNNVSARGDIDLFDLLVSRGADPLLSTAVHSASRCEDPDMSKAMVCHLLDKYNMDINRDNEDFRDFFHDAEDSGTPLSNAVLHRNLAVVLGLLERGASASDPTSRTVYNAVKAGGLFPALEPLLCAGADLDDALYLAVYCQNCDATKLCLEFGADPAPALPRALEQEENRVKSVARATAHFERQPDEDVSKDGRFEEQRAAERNSKAILDLLRSAIESGAVSCDTSPQ